MSTTQFMTPYEAQKVISGVITALPKVRPEFLQNFFEDVGTSDNRTVNFDREYHAKNVMGTFAAADADLTPVQLSNFSTEEVVFSYAKETIGFDSFETLNQRQIGQQLGPINVLANRALRLQAKMAEVEQRFRNLFELTAANIICYGGYSSWTEYHPEYRYDFKRTVIQDYKYIKPEAYANATVIDLPTLGTELAPGRAPAVNLTTAAVTAPWSNSQVIMPVLASDGANYTAGEKVWNKANIDAGTATPVQDLTIQLQTVAERKPVQTIIMSEDAYKWFNYDVEKNYKDAASKDYYLMLATSRDILPTVQNIQGLTLKRMWDSGAGNAVPIMVYNGSYNDRKTGTYKKYITPGWSLVLPANDGNMRIYGRIQHRKANWEAMPRWINYWTDDRTGAEGWDYHTSFIMASTNMDAISAWKVC